MDNELTYVEQRYLHAAVIGPGARLRDFPLWKSVGTVRSGRIADIDLGEVQVEFRTIEFPVPLGREAPEKRLRAKSGNFIYDLMAIHHYRDGAEFMTIAVPYVELGIDIMTRLRQRGLLERADFLRPDLDYLVGRLETTSDIDPLLMISKLEVGLRGYPDVTGVALSGDRILGTEVYNNLMDTIADLEPSPNAEDPGVHLKRCVVKVLTQGGKTLSVWCDTFGNYRLWVQRSGRNAAVFADFVDALIRLGATSSSASIPFYRARSEGDSA